MFCPNCGRNVNDTAKFCVGCGTPLGGAEQQNQPVFMLQNEFLNAEPNKKKSKKWPVFVVLGVLVIACGVFIAVLRGKGDTTAEKTTKKTETIKDTLEQLEKANIGEYVTFGTYEQDNNLSNGAESIEWLVLEKKDGKVFLLSKYSLDYKNYNEKYTTVTWEDCTLRTWLNDSFYETAFNEEQRSAIAETLVYNYSVQGYLTHPANNTLDKVFLLSKDEAEIYFEADLDSSDQSRIAQVTEYAIAQGALKSASWWLRSLGEESAHAVSVDDEGRVNQYGNRVNNDYNVVRPAIWVSYSVDSSIPDSAEQADNNAKLKDVKKVSVGSYISFGSYEQDNNQNNGAEPIEWLVLKKIDGKALLLSKYALDVKPYNEEYKSVTWATCTLRNWLNNEFYNTAFNNQECNVIIETLVENKKNQDSGMDGGNNTEDKVFLLSIEEANIYFDFNQDDPKQARVAQITEYAKAQGGEYSENDETYGNSMWWLRSPGFTTFEAATVGSSGNVGSSGRGVSLETLSVRPAIWVAY